MTPFEEWWEVQDFHDKAEDAARAAWDAAFVLASKKILDGTYWDLSREVS